MDVYDVRGQMPKDVLGELLKKNRWINLFVP